MKYKALEQYKKAIGSAHTESADAALQLVGWMRKPENGGWDTQCSQWSRGKGWRVTFAKGEGKTYVGFIGTADTFALAICLAFLKANNIEPMEC